jgi:hypothetical protein
MARLNRPNAFTEKTHEDAPAHRMTPLQALRRSVCACFLWEDEFYESGTAIAERIGSLVAKCDPQAVASLAIEVRNQHNLRHVPLALLTHLAVSSRGTSIMRETVPQVVRRADELTELCAMWWKLHPDMHLPHNMEKGLRAAWSNFNEYSLAKYDRDNAVKLRDVMRLTHPKAYSEDRNALYSRVIDRTLATPDTWEVELSSGADKRVTWTRLLTEHKLGGLALLRNLRNMVQAQVDPDLIRAAIRENEFKYVLPFRFTAAARYVPMFERELDAALCRKVAESTPFTGNTLVLVDVSGSMKNKLSAKSDMSRIDAAATLASIIEGPLRVFTFSSRLVEVPPRRGMAGVDAIIHSQMHSSTRLGDALRTIYSNVRDIYRLIVITDEQSHDRVDPPLGTIKHAYMINVASNRNGVSYDQWTHIDGFSESVLRFIQEIEKEEW